MVITLIITALVLASLIVVLKTSDDGRKPKNKPTITPKPYSAYTQPSPGQGYYIGWKTFGLTPRQGYWKMKMTGMSYRGICAKDLGKFEGYAKAQTDNEHDPFAIAIYREDDVHVGFLEGGNRILHSYIIRQGGAVHCYGYIACGKIGTNGIPTPYYAEVCVETDKNSVKMRNKAYATDDKFYQYEQGKLKAYLNSIQL